MIILKFSCPKDVLNKILVTVETAMFFDLA